MNYKNLVPISFSAKTTLGCVLILLIYLFFQGFDPHIISWDTYGYYLFLPQAFIHGDLGIENFEPITHALENQVHTSTFYQASGAPTGSWVIKYPMGMSIFYAPFFFIGLFFSWIGGFEMNGFSKPFQYSMLIGSIVYMLIGIRLLWKILNHFFSQRVTAITMVLIIFGTNYYQIHTGSHCMPHVYLFTAYAALIWATVLWYERRKLKHALFIGLIIGLMTISRPTEFLSILIPMLYGLKSPVSIFDRIKKIKIWYKHILVAGIAIAIMIIPQLIYWKVYAGSWLYNSHNNPGEGLDILSPNPLDFLFSFRKGWLTYTPLMIFSLVGIFLTRKLKSGWFWSILTFSVLYIYVHSCWSTWWYATSFSQRTMVQVYPVLAIAFACFIQAILVKKWRWIFLVLVFLGCLNLFQIWQYQQGIIDPSRMTQRYYWEVFGATKYDKDLDKYLLVKRSVTDEESLVIFEECYSIDTTYFLVDNVNSYAISSTFTANNAATVLPSAPSPLFETKFQDLTSKDHAWIHVTGTLASPGDLDSLMVTNTFAHKGKAYKYKRENITPYLLPQKDGLTVFHIMYLTPEVRTVNDTYQFYFNNESKTDTVIVADVTMEVYLKLDDCE